MELHYKTKRIGSMTDMELSLCSDLYSNHYGKYSGVDNPAKAGKRIKMGVGMYKSLYQSNPDIFVSMCFQKDRLLGHAVFLIKDIPGKGKCSWVLQLVVDSHYRNHKIGTKLLQSAWGFSDFYAWGLATANAITLKTLEAVTWRVITVEDITQHIDTLRKLMEDVPFADSTRIKLSPKQSQIFSNFYPELERSNTDSSLSIYTARLGKVSPGYEWLAFTFASQPMSFDEKHFEAFMEFSDSQLRDAYSRMDMPTQGWTKGTQKEVDFILKNVPLTPEARILDLGCGQGRHCLEIAQKGFNHVVGIDFSDANIDKAISCARAMAAGANFIVADARMFKLGVKFDLILCLYDVIGSFRKAEDNLKIIRTIKQNMRRGGYAVISVMNMELTRHIAKNVASIRSTPHNLLKLPPSHTMEVSGNIFNPDYFLINTDDNLVYRKEQFSATDEIYAEYIVADKRYTMDEIVALFDSAGFITIEKRYVQAGHWEDSLRPTDPRAKEILLILSLPRKKAVRSGNHTSNAV